ncbi:lycopene cyclase domain-containing protein [Microbacterium sp. BK668]|uniref:lycopene cyclase domain-containing protein n=1 Tax=Microbacterium sp. BK668 TaxID=2512118 RepID=UPI00105C361B|nr:lycopene cyclase domain-containing protein [Microbacterium sp. BK668]TDN92520.1 lycopene cyclase domain-containing protein [Microbacterium sp. BK668]
MPGLYLLAILLSLAGIVIIDLRWRLALPVAAGRTLAAVGIGTVFFLAWDAVGIANGIFLKGDSPLYVGFDFAPELPLEEPVFLIFLCYLALVTWAGAMRLLARGRRGSASEASAGSAVKPGRSDQT